MFSKKIFSFFLAACSHIDVNAQRIEPLNIGDTLPTIVSQNVINYVESKINLDDFEGTPLLIDFWSPSCISCIQSFPKLEALQKTFKDSIRIILVNTQSLDSTKRFFSLRKKVPIPGVLLITGDSVLSKLFPHIGEPYHVWLDKNGIVSYQTYGYNATPEHIRDFILDKKLDFVLYKPRQKYIKSLYDENWYNSLEYFSYISHCIDGIKIGSGLDSGANYVTANCSSIVDLYILAYNEFNKHNFSRPGRLLLEVNDSSRFLQPGDNNKFEKWRMENAYNYQLLLPTNNTSNKYEIMQQDLRRFFGLQVSVVKRNVSSWVLVRTSNQDKLKSKSKFPFDNFRADDVRDPINDTIRYFYKQDYKDFSSRLGAWIEYYMSLPFVDATGINEIIDIEMKGTAVDSISISELKKALKKYDLDLIKKKCAVDVLVINEKKSGIRKDKKQADRL